MKAGRMSGTFSCGSILHCLRKHLDRKDLPWKSWLWVNGDLILQLPPRHSQSSVTLPLVVILPPECQMLLEHTGRACLAAPWAPVPKTQEWECLRHRQPSLLHPATPEGMNWETQHKPCWRQCDVIRNTVLITALCDHRNLTSSLIKLLFITECCWDSIKQIPHLNLFQQLTFQSCINSSCC